MAISFSHLAANFLESFNNFMASEKVQAFKVYFTGGQAKTDALALCDKVSKFATETFTFFKEHAYTKAVCDKCVELKDQFMATEFAKNPVGTTQEAFKQGYEFCLPYLQSAAAKATELYNQVMGK